MLRTSGFVFRQIFFSPFFFGCLDVNMLGGVSHTKKKEPERRENAICDEFNILGCFLFGKRKKRDRYDVTGVNVKMKLGEM